MGDEQGARGTVADGRWHERLRSLVLEEERPGTRRHSHHGYRKERLPFFVQRCYIFANITSKACRIPVRGRIANADFEPGV